MRKKKGFAMDNWLVTSIITLSTGRRFCLTHDNSNFQKVNLMSRKVFLKGPKLFSLARKKALRLDIPQEKGIKLEELIARIQRKEGNHVCFNRKETCSETECCWQASCTALIA